ncbi:hypothetical protein ACO2Q3_21245 [Caulobacter sp. KR2-114]|uniref:hypothetical protein n=1 Tax=Caulobacter sp. KR2-114 TaxID=3400912 RepID=UPI003C038D07
MTPALPRRHLAWLITAVLGVAGCSGHRLPAAGLSDEDILAAIDRRTAPQGPGSEMHFLVRSARGGEEIACGYAGPHPHTAATGPPVLAHDTIFIARGHRLMLEGDVPDADFERLQNRFCGPDWIAPPHIPAVP